MDNQEMITLSKYRIEQAKENLEAAEALFNINIKVQAIEHITQFFMP